MSYNVIAWLLLPLVLLAARSLLKRFRQPAPYPPGPPRDPLIGNVRNFPTEEPYAALTKMAKQYGDVMYFEILGKQLVILSSHQAASDLLEKRSAIYSSRPRFIVHEMIGWTDMLTFLPYGEPFQRQRKLVQQVFTKKGCLDFRPSQMHETHVFMKNLLKDSVRFQHHIERFTTAIITEITYGHRITTDDDMFIDIVEKTNDILQHTGHSLALVDCFPFLKYLPSWFPGMWFNDVVKTAAPFAQQARALPFQQVRKEMAAGTAFPSFLTQQFEKLEEKGGGSEEELEVLKIVAAQMQVGGAETTWSTLLNFMANMLMNPEVQRKAQAELDTVLGGKRLPDWGDRESLPYVNALIWESARWHPSVPLSLPHAVDADDIYKGFFIPKGATVLANATALARDEAVYKNPEEFRPERFLGPDPEPLPVSIGFGWGRRVCPGMHLADASVYLMVASILTVFEIIPAKDGKGEDIFPKLKWIPGLTSRPHPYPVVIRPRSEAAALLVEQLHV